MSLMKSSTRNLPILNWDGPAGIASVLGVNTCTLKDKLWVWNAQKIRFAQVPADARNDDPAILKIAGGVEARGAGGGIAALSHFLSIQPSDFERSFPKELECLLRLSFPVGMAASDRIAAAAGSPGAVALELAAG